MTGEEAESINERSMKPLQASTTDRTVDILQEVARAYLARLDGVPTGDIEVDVPFWHDLAVEQAARLRAEARSSGGGGESDDGRSDRPGLSGALSRAADILLEVVRAQQEHDGVALPIHGDHAEWWALTAVKALMMAGWSAPEERTIGIPNGLVLHPGQWQDLAAGRSTWIITPGGDQALQLKASAFQRPPSPEVLESLWLYRELTRTTEWGKPTEMRYDPRDVTVPRSFLTFLVQLTRELRVGGDYAAANSLDNSLAVIAPELREAGIAWEDGGGSTPATPASPGRPARTRERDAFGVREPRTHTVTNYFAQLQNAARVHADALHGRWPSTWLDPWSDEEFQRDVTTVLEYVSGGYRYAWKHADRYQDAVARRALGRLGDTPRDAPRGTSAPGGQTSTHPVEVDDVIVGKWLDAFADRYPHLATAKRVHQPLERYEELENQLAQARRDLSDEKRNVRHLRQVRDDLQHALDRSREDNQRTKDALTATLAAHPTLHDEFEHVHDRSMLRAGYLAEQAANLLTWYEDEVQRLKREPNVDDRRYSADGWARVEGIHLLNYAGWAREKLDPKTPIARTQFLELTELCEWERVGTSVHDDDVDPTEETTDYVKKTADTDGDAPEWTIS